MTEKITPFEASNKPVQSVVILDILAKSHPQDAIRKLSEYVAVETNSDDVAIFYTRRINGDPSLVQLPFTTPEKIDYREQPLDLAFEHRPLLCNMGVCEWVLKNNSWLYGNDIESAAEAKNNPIQFQGEHRKVKLTPSTSKHWTKTNDEDDEIALAILPMSWVNEENKTGANAVLSLRKTPGNSKPHFTHADMVHALKLCRMIQICCQHILRIYKANYQAKHLHTLMTRLKETDSPKKANQYCLESIARIMDAKFCLLIEMVEIGAEENYYVFSGCIFVNEENENEHRRALKTLQDFCFKLNVNSNKDAIARLIGEIEKKLRATLQFFNQRAQEHQNMLLRELLPVNKYLTAAIIDMGNPENQVPTNFAWPLPDPQELQGLVQRIKITFDMHLMKSIRKNIQRIKDDFNEPEEIYKKSLEKLAELTGADYAMLYFLKENNRVKLTKYISKSNKTQPVYLGKDTPIKKTLTWHSIASNTPYCIPEIKQQEISKTLHINYKVLKQVIGDDYQYVKSWLSCPFGYSDNNNDFIGVGTIKLMGLNENEHLSSTSMNIAKAFSEFIFQHYREKDKVDALKELNKINNRLSRYSGRNLAVNLIEELEQWAEKFLKQPYFIAIRASDSFGALINSVSQTIEDPERVMKQLVDNKEQENLWLNGKRYYCHVSDIVSLGIKELKGELFFLFTNSIFDEHRKLIKEAAVDISTLICQEHLRQKRARQLTRFKHAIIGPVGAIASSALTIRSIVRETDISKTEDLDLFKRSLLSISSEINTISHWTSLTRILGDDETAQVILHRHSMSKLITKCVERFEEQAESRRIRLTTQTSSKNIEFYFDQFAFDIIVSNLIENAIKYAFYNTDIEITFGRGWNTFYLTVTDTGHGLPDNFLKNYKEGSHFTWKDPYRIIPGGGYGIAIIESLVKAHNGTFEITSKPITKIEKDTQRHLVVARVEIPYQV